jgi:hypothetical protein
MRTEPSSPRRPVRADSASRHVITTREESAGTADGYPLPATWRGVGAQAAAASLAAVALRRPTRR